MYKQLLTYEQTIVGGRVFHGNETVLVSKRDVISIRDSARYPRSPEHSESRISTNSGLRNSGLRNSGLRNSGLRNSGPRVVIDSATLQGFCHITGNLSHYSFTWILPHYRDSATLQLHRDTATLQGSFRVRSVQLVLLHQLSYHKLRCTDTTPMSTPVRWSLVYQADLWCQHGVS